MFLAKQKEWVLNKLNDRFIRNLGWMGISKLITRSTRIVATVFLARYLTRYDYGLAALVLTTYEFTQIFTRFGIGAKLIQADEKDIDELADGAYWLNWVLYACLFVVQCIASVPVAIIYKDTTLIPAICAMAGVYLISPFGRIQQTLIERENRLKIVALASAAQMAFANLLTAGFAIADTHLWAVVLPKLISSPISIIIFLRCHPWRARTGFTTKRWREIFRFGWNILLVSLLSAIRDNLDYLLMGSLLGVRSLGLYFFAFNSGLGISLEVIQAINLALYPHMCAARSEWSKFRQRYFKSLKAVASIVIPLVILQSSLAPIYVPIVFGQKWTPAVPILMIICISAIPRAFSTVASFLLMAVDKPHISMYWNAAFTAIFAIALFVGIHWNVTGSTDDYGYIVGVAIAVLAVHVIFVPIFVIWTTRFVFGKDKDKVALKPGG
jgi:teichuronic acid exporter